MITLSNTMRRSLLGIALALIVVVGVMWAIQVRAGNNPTAPVNGYAWSSNIGWIQFSGTTKGGTSFGVREDIITGDLFGYAWSSNIGWIHFNGTQVASNGVLSGYAQACSAYLDKNKCSGALDPNSGGWDGRIHLSGTALDGSYYGVVQKTDCTWSGYAWGSYGIGAIHTKGTNYGVTVAKVGGNCSFGAKTIPSYCPIKPTGTITASPSRVSTKNAPINLTWSISGFDKSNFAAAQCKIVRNGDIANGIKITTGASNACTITGSVVSQTISSQTIYALYCNGAYLETSTGATVDTVVNVTPNFNEF